MNGSNESALVQALDRHMLIITGTHYAALFHKNKKRFLHDKGGTYYGVSWSTNRLYLLWRNYKKGEIILVYDEKLELIEQIPIGKFIDGHQILFIQNQLFLTNTHENSVMVLHPQTGTTEDIKVSCHEHDVNHINGLSYIDKDHLWILFSNGKVEYDSEIKKYKICSKRVVDSLQVGKQIHNYAENFITSSHSSTFLKFNKDDQQIQKTIQLEGWIRGLDFIGNTIVVGSSMLACREDRLKKDSGQLFFLDKDLNILNKMAIDDIGQINDVRVISKNYSHNDIIFPTEL